MQTLSVFDRLVLFAANLYAALRHPYLALSFLWRRRRTPAFATPRGYGELVQWRKIFDRNPLFPVLVDKLAVKQWAADTVPGTRAAEVLWVGARPEDIPAALVSPGHVIKTNHGTRFNYFPARQPLPRPELDRRLAGWLQRRFSDEVQWAYGQVDRKLFVERQLGIDSPLWELTYRCCDGKVVTAFMTVGQRTADEKSGYFEPDGRRLGTFGRKKPGRQLPDDFRPPPAFHAGRLLAEQLSHGLDYVRVDLMWDGGSLYLCEMTIYPGSGFGDETRTGIADRIEPVWLEAIERSWFLSTPQPFPLSLYASAVSRWMHLRRQELAASSDPVPVPAPPAPAP